MNAARGTSGCILIANRPLLVVQTTAGDAPMVSRVGMRFVALAAVLVLANCGGAWSSACRCPKLVAYDEPTLKKISQALRALPSDNVLHQAMEDYENERDDLRFCQ